MKDSTILKRVVDEIKQVPEESQSQLFDIIHHFRAGLHIPGKKPHHRNFADCWKDMPKEMYEAFLNELNRRRHSNAGLTLKKSLHARLLRQKRSVEKGQRGQDFNKLICRLGLR
jgi:hypothetical protein